MNNPIKEIYYIQHSAILEVQLKINNLTKEIILVNELYLKNWSTFDKWTLETYKAALNKTIKIGNLIHMPYSGKGCTIIAN